MSKKIRKDIQALRALAVMAVVVYHLWPDRLVGGFMGVDIFFVISGYLMTLTLLKGVDGVISSSANKIRATGTYLAEFYARRIKRLIPAAAVTLLVTLGMVVATGQLNLIQKTAEQITASALFVQNWLLANESVDYLAASEPPTAVQHFWSLSLEEQFYLVWPLLLVLIGLMTVSLTILYKNKKIPGAILPVSVLAVAFFIYGYLLTKSDPSAAYFVTPARVWELIIGGLIAFLPALKNYDLKLLLPWFGLALNLYALYSIGGENFPGWHALIPVIGTALIIYGGTGRESDSRFSFARTFRARPIQWIGDISYSLYLWHWPLIILLPTLLMINIDGQYGLIIKIGIFLLSLLVAWLSYKFVEQPPLRLSLKRWQVYVGFVIVVGGVAGGSFAVAQSAKAASEKGLSSLHEIAKNKNESCFGARSITNDCPESFGAINREWAQYVKADASLSLIENDNQWCDYYRIGEQDDETKYCTYGDTSSDKSIVVWGDSHSDHWANALNRVGKEANIRFVHLSSGSCANTDINQPKCADRIDFIKQEGLLQNAEAVIVSLWLNDNSSSVEATLEELQSLTNSSIYLLQDVPEAGPEGGPECYLMRQSCTNTYEVAMLKVNKTIAELIDTGVIKNSQVVKTEDLFCKDQTCFSFIGGASVYRDVADTGNSHISSTYTLSLAEILADRLKGVLARAQS